MSDTHQMKKTVLLFGKTGDGKSTVANMLLDGKVNGRFTTGSSLVAVTEETMALDNELNWTIIDTVGMLAADRPTEDRSHARELRNYLAKNHPDIDVFCYVKKASRFTGADEQCWKAFNTLFDGVKPSNNNIVLVFTSCNQGPEWVNQYQGILDQHMKNQFGTSPYSKVAVDFPPFNDNTEMETALKSSRAESLERLKAAVDCSTGPVRLSLVIPESPEVLEKIESPKKREKFRKLAKGCANKLGHGHKDGSHPNY